MPRHLVPALVLCLGTAGCYSVLPSDGGGQAAFSPPRQVRPADILLPEGYRAEAVATGLTFPTGVAFDPAGTPYVTEAGYSYGEVFLTPRLLRIGSGGTAEVVAEGRNNGPWNGVTWHDGAFYVAEGGELEGGRILRIVPGRPPVALVEDLPSVGDHHTNGPVVGPDGWLYFGQGTATNSGVVGPDNYDFGWLGRYPDFHDVPCRDVTLAGVNYGSDNPLTEAADEVVTGAFVPFGTPVEPGRVVRGAVPCSGAVLRVRPEGGPVELVAWGFRNPFGLAFAPDGTLYLTENAYDERGSRPVFGTADHLWRVEPGRWYGWPDFAGGDRLDDPRYASPSRDVPPQPVLARHPGDPPRPLASFGVHSSSNGLDAAPGGFGYPGEVFVAQFGDMAPDVGKVMDPVGFRVVRADPATGVVRDFAVNRQGNGPASLLETGGLERPVAVRFGPDGALYVVDFGVMLMNERGPDPQPGTGVLWRIAKQGG
ncbi:hypothetical protein [Arenibaculum sp.]|jgi:glucose/arabinose dehydrogenase|uniref:PQQ-dependent sugar dehydrogenase n=1 Tax=Arenibaculum sp. TaxID=2865862 RepID=UPI002E143214|nr:hypothetical protein [Arenibaculum sp.]